MQKMCSWAHVIQQVISRLQADFEVTTQLWLSAHLIIYLPTHLLIIYLFPD